MAPKGQQTLRVALADFHGVNIPTKTNFKLPNTGNILNDWKYTKWKYTKKLVTSFPWEKSLQASKSYSTPSLK